MHAWPEVSQLIGMLHLLSSSHMTKEEAEGYKLWPANKSDLADCRASASLPGVIR